MLSSLCKAFLGRQLTGNAAEKKILAIRTVMTIIDRYNKIATEKNMPKAAYPVYNNVDMTSLAFIERDAAMAYNSLVAINEVNRGKMARNVVWRTGLFSVTSTIAWFDGLWYYIQEGEDIYVYADTEEMKKKINGTTLVLDYADMPYELLVDNNGKEWKVTIYGAPQDIIKDGGLARTVWFGTRNADDDWNNNVAKKLKSLTLRNWTNRNINRMDHAFNGCINLETLDLSSFDTRSVRRMIDMFHDCDNLKKLTLGENFVVPSGYRLLYKTYLAPTVECEITLNKSTYDALTTVDLVDYTIDPSEWDADNGNVQTITVTPPAGP